MKYNKRDIMKKAWNMYRKGTETFARCLHLAWTNAKAIAKMLLNEPQECHTWYGWKMLGYTVIHESKAKYKVTVTDLTTLKGWRILSYFTREQVELTTE